MKRLAMLVVMVCFGLFVMGCEPAPPVKKPPEPKAKVSDKVEKAADKAVEKVDKATEKAVEKVDKAVEKTEKAVDKAADKVMDKVDKVMEKEPAPPAKPGESDKK